MKYLYDEFFQEVWDQVSEYVVNDDFFFSFDKTSLYDPEYPEINEQFIRSLTFDLYRNFDKKNLLESADHDTRKRVASEAAKLMEMFFSNLLKYKPILEAPKPSHSEEIVNY